MQCLNQKSINNETIYTYMHILSIDVGIRNLAYILVETQEIDKHVIVDWTVLELIQPHEKAAKVDNTVIGKNMCEQLDTVLKDKKIDIILIENQIGQNAIKMKAIQGMLNMYFIMRNYEVSQIINYNAIHKLKYFLKDKQKTTYGERKKMSKEITHCLCKIYYGDDILTYYDTFKKKDDLADCLLQVLDYIYKQKQLTPVFYEKIKNYIMK